MTDEKRVYIDPSVFTNIAIGSMLQQQSAATPERPVFPSGPEPDRVYGYVAFVDPTSGAEHLPRFTIGTTMGTPGNIVLRFVNPAGETYDLTVATRYREAGFTPDGVMTYDRRNWAEAVAWYYDIKLGPDQSLTGPPTAWPDATLPMPRTALVTYNPDAWRYLDIVSVGSWQRYTETGQQSGSVEFNRRPEPFADLPDSP